ncbi:MAG: hypothetical protein M1336_04075 [Deltaproteobacteria bacterium]|nr:hypothetical protein [Deltaproteobacteria bacterium]
MWLVTLALLAGCAAATAQQERNTQPLFLPEYGAMEHGRKTLLDRILETDPGGVSVETSPEYRRHPPLRIAVLPFVDRGSGNYILDKLPLTMRDSERLAEWRWTDSNRLRKLVHGFLSQREFETVALPQVDAALAAHGITNDAKLSRVPPQTLARWLGADTVVYGAVLHYEVYYLFLLAGWEVTLKLAIVSGQTGDLVLAGEATRYKLEFRPAVDWADIAMNSAFNTTDLRDVDLRRAEEEAAREVVLRFPLVGGVRGVVLSGRPAQARDRQAMAASASDAAPSSRADASGQRPGPAPPNGLSQSAETLPTSARVTAAQPPGPSALATAPVLAALATGYGDPDEKPEQFFLPEFGLRRHGRKTILDRMIETDPQMFALKVAPDYCRRPPQRIAVLPFAYEGSGNLLVNRVPVTLRTAASRSRWRWTYANRLRRVFTAFLAQREFTIVPLPEVDATLAAHSVLTTSRLEAVPARQLARWLGADALVYGDVSAYEGLYGFLVAGWHVNLHITLVSGTTGQQLVGVDGGRYAMGIKPAIAFTDILIDSGLGLLELRDVRLRRAEEEVCRELVLRVPSCLPNESPQDARDRLF